MEPEPFDSGEESFGEEMEDQNAEIETVEVVPSKIRRLEEPSSNFNRARNSVSLPLSFSQSLSVKRASSTTKKERQMRKRREKLQMMLRILKLSLVKN